MELEKAFEGRVSDRKGDPLPPDGWYRRRETPHTWDGMEQKWSYVGSRDLRNGRFEHIAIGHQTRFGLRRNITNGQDVYFKSLPKAE